MELSFFKYQGTGNDFIILDNRRTGLKPGREMVARLCDRRFGIGADGFMLLEDSQEADFHMVYYNADGNISTMCGNGGRCITAFAQKLGIIEKQALFSAADGLHRARIGDDGEVALVMQNVADILTAEDHTILNTGSPHYVSWQKNVGGLDVRSLGRDIRNSDAFREEGINVNFTEQEDGQLFVRTYERGVEDETLSCGTGVTAAAIAASGTQTGTFYTRVRTPGGMLTVSFSKPEPGQAENVTLIGPAVFVFEGRITAG